MVCRILIGLTAFLSCVLGFAQTPLGVLVAGRSLRADVERMAGNPVHVYNQSVGTLVEYHPYEFDSKHWGRNIAKLYVQYRANSSIVERMEILRAQPISRADAITSLNKNAAAARQPNLPEQPTAHAKNGERLIEYFGAPHYVVLTYQGPNVGSGVARSARYSRELFESVVPATTGDNPAAQSQAGLAATTVPDQLSAVLKPLEALRAHVFTLTLLTPISSANSRTGDVVRAQVVSSDPAQGSIVSGTILRLDCGSSGVPNCVLDFSLDWLTYNGQRIPVVGSLHKLANADGGNVIVRDGNYKTAILNPQIAAAVNHTSMGPHAQVFFEFSANGPTLSFAAGSELQVALNSDFGRPK